MNDCYDPGDYYKNEAVHIGDGVFVKRADTESLVILTHNLANPTDMIYLDRVVAKKLAEMLQLFLNE